MRVVCVLCAGVPNCQTPTPCATTAHGFTYETSHLRSRPVGSASPPFQMHQADGGMGRAFFTFTLLQ